MTSVPPDNPPAPPEPPVPPQPQDPQQPPYGSAAYQQSQYAAPQVPVQTAVPAGYAQPPAQYQQAYPQQYAYAPTAPRTNVLAIVALVLSLVGVSIGGVITGHIALSQVKKTAEQGRGLALAGLIIGYIGSAGWLLFWVFLLILPLIMVAVVGSTAGSLDYSAS